MYMGEVRRRQAAAGEVPLGKVADLALSAKGSNRGPGDENRCWRVLVVAVALACWWGLFGLENWLGAQARAMTLLGLRKAAGSQIEN